MPTLLRDRPRLGQYRLCAELATGGMGTVYLADAPGQRLRQCVAIKRIHPHLAQDPVFLEMFFDEATIASRIQHTHVCHVFDLDFQDGQYFLAMEYLLGEPLSRVARTLRRLPDRNWERHAALVARMFADACEGLHAAHELVDEAGEPLDVVHRDVSPENIFLTYDGVVKIVDFGVASASRQLHRTQTGVLKGKYAYLQPEVVEGQRPDRRGDIWGIGVVLWELLTCRRLFNRESDFDTLRAVTDSEIPLPSAVESRLPPELDAIVMKALRRNPDERYATARELGEDLGRFVIKEGEPVSLSHLSEWISELFPGGRARQEQFIEMALQETASETSSLPDRNSEESTTSLWTTPDFESRASHAAPGLPPAPMLPVLTPALPIVPPAPAPRSLPPDADTVVAGASYPEQGAMHGTMDRTSSAPAGHDVGSPTDESASSFENAGTFPHTNAFARSVRSRWSLPAPATWLASAAVILSAAAIWSGSAQAERVAIAQPAAAIGGPSPLTAPRPAAGAPTPDDVRGPPSPVTLRLPASVFETGAPAVSTPLRLEPGTYVVELRPGERDDEGWSLELRPTTQQAVVVGTFEASPGSTKASLPDPAGSARRPRPDNSIPRAGEPPRTTPRRDAFSRTLVKRSEEYVPTEP